MPVAFQEAYAQLLLTCRINTRPGIDQKMLNERPQAGMEAETAKEPGVSGEVVRELEISPKNGRRHWKQQKTEEKQ